MDEPDDHPTQLTVLNGSGDGNYQAGETVSITATGASAGYVFLGWTILSKGGSINSWSEEAEFVMPDHSATVAAIYGKVETWFPPGDEDAKEGVLLPRGPIWPQKRIEQRVRVSFSLGDGEKYVKKHDLWWIARVLVDWFPKPEVQGTWGAAEIIRCFNKKAMGTQIERGRAIPKDSFVEVASGVFEASIWHESLWTWDKAVEKAGDDGDIVLPKVDIGINLGFSSNPSYFISRMKTQGALLPIELVDINDHSNSEDDETIVPWDTTQNIATKNIAWIDAHTSDQNLAPRMPQLEIRMPDLLQGTKFEAKLEVKYDRGNGARTARNQPEDIVRIPSDGSFKQVSGNTWKIWNEYQNEDFFGGNATLSYRLKKGSTEILPETKIDFRIVGKNPDDARCRAYIETLPDAEPNGSLWFAYAIAKSESKDYNGQGSRYNQFLELPTHTQDAGRPLWGNDGGTTPGGYGMFQVTGNAFDSTADIPRKQIWNWQENIAGGLAILASKRTTAIAWMNQQKNANNANGTALSDHTVGIVTFSEGTARTMTHTVTIKLYNGASRAPTGFVDSGSAPGFRLDPQGSGHYCFWRNASNEWVLNRFNDPPDPIQPFNYVARVCEEVEN